MPDSVGLALTWYDQVDWANNLEYLGFNDWRLASMARSAPVGSLPGTTNSHTSVNCSSATEMECRDNELGYMYYYNLGGIFGDDLTGTQIIGDVTLSNITKSDYISGTERIFTNGLPKMAWIFIFDSGYQLSDPKIDNGFQYGWAVRDGDVVGVPEPPIVLLLATGLLELIWTSRKKSAK